MREGFFKTPLFALVLLAAVGLGIWAYAYQHQYDPLYDAIDPEYVLRLQQEASTTPQSPAKQSTPGQYVSERFGFSFTYPKDWYVETDRLDSGATNGSAYVQMYNYDRSNLDDTPGWGAGHNKIEFSISSNGSGDVTGGTTNVGTTVELDGVSALRVDTTGDGNWVTYSVPLRMGERKFLNMTIYGDRSNFYILDNIMATLKWARGDNQTSTPAAFSAKPISGRAPLTVHFSQTVTDDWRALVDFGDGSSCGSDECSRFVHTYTQPGTYTAMLRSLTGTDSASRPPLGSVSIFVQ